MKLGKLKNITQLRRPSRWDLLFIILLTVFIFVLTQTTPCVWRQTQLCGSYYGFLIGDPLNYLISFVVVPFLLYLVFYVKEKKFSS